MIPIGTRVVISKHLEDVAVRLHHRTGTVVGHREFVSGPVNDVRIDGEKSEGPYDPWAVEGHVYGLPDFNLEVEA